VLLLNESCPHHNFLRFIMKHSVAQLLPTRNVTNVLPKLKLLNAMTTYLIKSFTTKNPSIWSLFRVWTWIAAHIRTWTWNASNSTFTCMHPGIYVPSPEEQVKNSNLKTKELQFTSIKAEIVIKFSMEWATNMNIVINQLINCFFGILHFLLCFLCSII
jgi:hypothetical protein